MDISNSMNRQAIVEIVKSAVPSYNDGVANVPSDPGDAGARVYIPTNGTWEFQLAGDATGTWRTRQVLDAPCYSNERVVAIRNTTHSIANLEFCW